MFRRLLLLAVVLCITFIAVSCGSETDESAQRSREIAVDLESDEQPTQQATSTTVPSSTSLPTQTPLPTYTPLPRNTSEPAATKTVEPTKTPEETNDSAGSFPVVNPEPASEATEIAPTEPLPTDPPPTAVPPTEPPPTEAPPTQPPPTAIPPTAVPPTEPPPATEPPAPTEPPLPPAAVTVGNIMIIAVNKGEEYVDIRNDSGQDIDLGGWVLISEKGNQACGLGGVLPSGVVLRIWAMAEDAGQGGFNCNFDSNIWNNSDPDPAVLIDPSGAEVSRK